MKSQKLVQASGKSQIAVFLPHVFLQLPNSVVYHRGEGTESLRRGEVRRESDEST